MPKESDQKVSLIAIYNKHYIKKSKMNNSLSTQNKSKCAKLSQTLTHSSLKFI